MRDFVFDGRDETDLAVDPLVVEGIDVPGDGDLEVVDALPRAEVAHELGLEKALERLRQRVEAPIDVKSSGRCLSGRLAVLVGGGDGWEQVVVPRRV